MPLSFITSAALIPAEDDETVILPLVMIRQELYGRLIVKLKGLESESFYKNSLTGEVCSGALLMNAGINLTNIATNDGDSIVIMFSKV